MSNWTDEVNHARQLDRETVGNGGAFGALSIADIDGDDKQEINLRRKGI